ncbi:hypothetical protein D3C80_1603100 [compost metagenome]
MGQGRPRPGRPAQGGYSRPGHAQRPAPQFRPAAPVSRPRPEPGEHPFGRCAHLRDDRPRRHRGRVPDRVAGADGHAAKAQAEELLRPGDRGGHRAPRADPGRHGPPLLAQAPEAGTGHLPLAEVAGSVRAYPGGAAVSGTGHGTGHGGCRLQPGRGRPVTAQHGCLEAPRWAGAAP